MKMNSIGWEVAKKKSNLYAWPTLISTPLIILTIPWSVGTAPVFSPLMPWLLLLVYVPFIWVDMRRNQQATAREKRELQAKYDAEDKAMFGKPLSEIEL